MVSTAAPSDAPASGDAEPADDAPSPPPSRPHRRRRIILRIVLGILLAIFAVWLVLFITKGRFLKHPFERTVGAATHRTVKVAGDFQLYFAPITIKFVAEGMSVSNPAWASKRDLFAAKRIEAHIATFPLIFGRRQVKTLDLQGGAVDLEWNRARQNTWTFSEKKGGKPFEMPVIDRAIVAGTTLRYLDPQLLLRVDLAFDPVRSTGRRIGDAIGVRGTGTLRQEPFRLTGTLQSPNETVAGGRNALTLRADFAHDRIDASGTLAKATQIDGADLTVQARGRNMAELFQLIGAAVPDTRTYRLNAHLTKEGVEYQFTRLTGTFGDSDIAGKLTVKAIEPRIRLDAVLTTRKLDIVDVAPFIGYNPDLVATKGAAAASGQGSSGGVPRLLPDAHLRVEAIKRFDAGVKYHVTTLRSKNIPISNIDLRLALENSLLKLAPLTFDMARGRVASTIVINARRQPVHTDYDIRLLPTPMGRLLAGFGALEAGTTGTIRGRAQLVGDGDTVHQSLSTSRGRIALVMPRGNLWARNIQLSELDIGTFVQRMFQDKLKDPVEINCGLIGFTVRNGVAAADPILIDTRKNVIVGRGGFRFRDESLDLAFRADAKKFSLFSGQSPIGLGGYFAAPAIRPISPELLGRAGVGLGLAAIVAPPAALLAFVDVGDAKSTACGPVLAGARAAQQRTTRGKPRDDVGHGTTSKAEDGKRRKKFLGIF